MKTNELRIGNYLNGKQGHVIITEIRTNNSVKIHDNTSSFYVGICLIPIEITEEWLLKLGFKKTDNQYMDNYIIKTDVSLFNSVGYDEEEKKWYYNNDYSDAGCYFVTYIKYVHELQNLYFAINKNELKHEL